MVGVSCLLGRGVELLGQQASGQGADLSWGDLASVGGAVFRLGSWGI